MSKSISKSTLTQLITLSILIVLVVVLSILAPEFLTYNNMMNVLRQVTFVIITGSAATMLMITGHMDLSVGSLLALSGVVFAVCAMNDIPLFLAGLLGVGVGFAFGVLNGILVTKLKVTHVIATLGSMYVARGLSYIVTDGKSINAGLPRGFDSIGRKMIGTIPIAVIIAVLVLLIFFFLESKTVFGKYAFAIGGNKNAATLSGIKSNRLVLSIYTLVGTMAGLSGVIMASRLGAGDPNVGNGFEFDCIVAIVLGGTSVAGGSGSVIGMAIGALIVGFLSNGLNLLGVGTFYQTVFKGVILVGAVLLDSLIKKKLK
ncbi:ABC transporter permease [Diplocloster agilis]|uniref:ABC transporter permease n=1 Tax=Diplocloster agilis TaxID=2850323 RepID=A0A949JZA1_9FIRM|nr:MULTISPECIES: ABC transporter permease [Lachnospiraceae]MBU9736931.1 ABC transporter permease [Diplocloster agilis]MBU9743906.1 ABC transporter permease [Diplocloster agilis]MCU6733655.1 ABC transporter permease [Suonthocola fibrivorans]SCJ02727.1 Ribose transport system permease protein rbsC [uncultured Clostridium sp.]